MQKTYVGLSGEASSITACAENCRYPLQRSKLS